MTETEAYTYIKEWLKDEYMDAKDREALFIALKSLDEHIRIGVYCIHGGICGGPGYVGFSGCDIHPEVRYGCEYCPSHCKDFMWRE